MSPTWAVVLAAGAGSRLGGVAKALLRLGPRTYLEVVARAARDGGAGGVAVVVGHHAEQVEPAARAVADLVVRNPRPDRGMGSSAREAARALPDGSALLIWPVDVPRVQPATVAAILAEARAAPGRIVVPVYGSAGGHPTLFPARLLPAVRGLDDDGRLDGLVRAEGAAVRRLEVEDPGVARDVDTPEDLEQGPALR